MPAEAAQATLLLQALIGKSLTQLCVGVGDLQMNFDGDLVVSVGGKISVGASSAVESHSLAGLAQLLPLLNNQVRAAGADEDGDLSLTIGAATLRCAADSRYEAWTYNGPQQALVVCMPGGGLAVWSSSK